MEDIVTICATFGLTKKEVEEVNQIAKRMDSIGYMDFEEAQQKLLQVLSYNPQELIDNFNNFAWRIKQNSRMYTNNWRKMHGLPMIRKK